MNEELTNIITNFSSLGNKRIDSLSKKVLKKMNFKSSKDLENMRDLCYWLYIYGYTEELAKLHPTIFTLSFSGNWNIWTPVELIYALIYYSSQNGDTENHAVISLEKIMQAEDDMANIKMRCNGSLLETRENNVRESIQSGNKTDIRESLYAEMRELVLIHSLGGSEKYPLEKIRTRVEEIKGILKGM